MLKSSDFYYTQEHFAALIEQCLSNMTYCRGFNATCLNLDPTTCRMWCSRLYVGSAAQYCREHITQQLEKSLDCTVCESFDETSGCAVPSYAVVDRTSRCKICH
eukprot:scaffold2765_cov165-Amphora_coffeaeformis.AAC.14